MSNLINFDNYFEIMRKSQDMQEKNYIECAKCGCEIYDGNECYCFENIIVCEDCFDEVMYKAKRDARVILDLEADEDE